MSPDPAAPSLPLRRLAAVLAGAACTAAALVVAAQAGADPDSAYPTDQRGYLDSSARCDSDQVLMAYGRTERALVAICVDADGDLEYRGVRLSDLAFTTLPAGRTADGAIVATNDGVTYAVSPTAFLVSEGDNVLYRDAWVEFRQPRFGTEPTSSAEPSTTAESAAAPTTTVSTTTVTPSKKPG